TTVPKLRWPGPQANWLESLTMRLRFRREAKRLRLWAQSHHVGLVYSNTIMNDGLYFLFSRLKCPVVTHVHELNYAIGLALSKRDVDEIRASTTRFVAASAAVAKALEIDHGVPQSLISVHHESIPTTKWPYPIAAETRNRSRQKLNVPADHLVVLGAGTADWRKGADLFVQLAKAAKTRDLSATFVWVGGNAADIRRMKHDADKLGVDDRLRWTGSVDNPLETFAAGDVF